MYIVNTINCFRQNWRNDSRHDTNERLQVISVQWSKQKYDLHVQIYAKYMSLIVYNRYKISNKWYKRNGYSVTNYLKIYKHVFFIFRADECVTLSSRKLTWHRRRPVVESICYTRVIFRFDVYISNNSLVHVDIEQICNALF